MMKYNLIRPCSECPFRSDFPKRFEGWLGHRAEKMVATVIIQSYTFACHKTVKRQDCDDEGEDICNDESEQSACAGALILHRKLNTTFENPGMRYLYVRGHYNPEKLDMTSPVFDTAEEFVDFHTK